MSQEIVLQPKVNFLRKKWVETGQLRVRLGYVALSSGPYLVESVDVPIFIDITTVKC